MFTLWQQSNLSKENRKIRKKLLLGKTNCLNHNFAYFIRFVHLLVILYWDLLFHNAMAFCLPLAGFEPAILGSGGRCLIHLATRVGLTFALWKKSIPKLLHLSTLIVLIKVITHRKIFWSMTISLGNLSATNLFCSHLAQKVALLIF